MVNQHNLPQDPYQYNGLALAYMGDAVYELYVRRHLLQQGGTKVNHLHVNAVHYVSAKAQALVLKLLQEQHALTEHELEIVKRGRNAKSATSPKNTEIHIYRQSTGFESLIGYLYLTEQHERLSYILNQSFEVLSKERDKA